MDIWSSYRYCSMMSYQSSISFHAMGYIAVALNQPGKDIDNVIYFSWCFFDFGREKNGPHSYVLL